MVVLFLVTTGVSGVFAYDLTIIPGGSQDVTGQSTIYFDIVFNPDTGGNSIDSYTFFVGYDTGELAWNSSNTSVTPPSPLTTLLGDPSETTPGLIENFNGASFSGSAVVINPTVLATVAFDIAPGINNPADGLPDVWFDINPKLGFTIDGANVPLTEINISGVSPDVYVLPEPISMILFVAGGATFGIGSYLRRRKQKTVSA